MALAQRLNELAVANSQGLLNDDEYRLLRQSVFEQHMNTTVTPVESPVVPIARVHVQLRAASPNPRRPSTKPNLEQPRPLPPPLARAKSSVNLGVANLIRRATGRKVSTPANDSSTNKDNSRKSNAPTPTSTPSQKRSMVFSRSNQKKPAELPPLRTDVSHITTARQPSKSSISTSHSGYRSSVSLNEPALSPPGSPLHPENTISTIRDVFDDHNLETARDIRSVIAITEDEAQRLIDAFNNLEAATMRRIQKQNARRLPANTPANLNVVMGGKEWREYRLTPSPSSPYLDGRPRQMLKTTLESNSDGKSLRSVNSGSSHRTSLSQSKSISSLPKINSISPLSPHFRSPPFRLARNNSVSSTSSQGTSLSSSGMLGVYNNHALTRSTSRLGLHRSKESAGMASTDTIGLTVADDVEDDPELSDVRKRREELITRYNARLEYLRARLKGAELHEKIMRK